MREWLWDGGPIDYSRPFFKDEPIDELCCEKCEYPIDEIDAKHYGGLCERCYVETEEFDRSLTIENAIKGTVDEVEIPDFLAFVYDEEQIKDILLAHFMELDNAKELIKEYALEDVMDWAERIRNV